MSPQILIFVLFLFSVTYTSEKRKPSQSISTIKTSSLENDTRTDMLKMKDIEEVDDEDIEEVDNEDNETEKDPVRAAWASPTEKFLQMPNSILTSVMTKYLNIIDIFHFYCINKKYYGIYEKKFQANVQEWFEKNTETLQIILGKQERVKFFLHPFPECEFIVNFPSAKKYPDTFADETTWECKFTIDVAVKPSTIPRLILEEENVESEADDSENGTGLRRTHKIKAEKLMTITISSTGIVTYKFAYDEISKIEIHGLKLQWKKEKFNYEFFDNAGNKFGFPTGCTGICAQLFGSQHKFPNSVQFEFPDCPFYNK